MIGLGDNGRERDGGEPLGEEEWDEVESGNEEFSLAEEDEPLPWLESGDYEDENQGSGIGRLLATFAIGLAVIGAILFGLWYWSNRPDPDLVADGSTIAAPEGPIRERPEDPGGKTFEGTGDVAPGVGEGETREGRLAPDNDATSEAASAATTTPRPSIDAAGSQTPESAVSGAGVQVGAYSTRASAEAGWSAINRQTDALQGVRYRIMEGKIESGTVYRLQAVPGDLAAANALCARLKAQAIPCQVKN